MMSGFLGFFGWIILAALLGGSAAGLLGVIVLGLRMPFLAVCTAHAAMAGAVFGTLVGVDATLAGLLGAMAGAVLLGLLLHGRSVDPNAALGTLFSLMMGLAFLGMGLHEQAKSEILGLLWGNLLFVSPAQVMLMGGILVLLVGFIYLFEKELKLILYSRALAAMLMPEFVVFAGVLVLAAGVITVNLEMVGGLLLYSLICNPAVAALKVGRSWRGVLVLGAVLGAFSALGGFLIAYVFDLTVGACIVLFSSLIVGVAMLIAHWRKLS